MADGLSEQVQELKTEREELTAELEKTLSKSEAAYKKLCKDKE